MDGKTPSEIQKEAYTEDPLKRRKPMDEANIKRIDWDETWKDLFDLETEVVDYLNWFEEVMSADVQADEDDEGSPDDMGCQHESIIPVEDQDQAATKVNNPDESSIVDNPDLNSIAVTNQHETAMTHEADIAVGNHFESAIIEGNQNETFITVIDKVKTTISVDNRNQNSITVRTRDQNAITVDNQDTNSIIIDNQVEKVNAVRNQEVNSSAVGNHVEKSIAVVNQYETSKVANKDETEINESRQNKTSTAASNQSETTSTMGYHDKATSTRDFYGSKSNMSLDAASISLNIDDYVPDKYCKDEKLINVNLSPETSNQSSNYENNATTRCSYVKLSDVDKFKLRLAEFSSVTCAFPGTAYSWMKRESEESYYNGGLVNQTRTDNIDSTTISKDQPDGAVIATHFPKVATRTSFSSERSVTRCEADVAESESSNDSNSIEKSVTKTGSNLRRFTDCSPISGNSDSFEFSNERRVEAGELIHELDVAAPTAVENQENVSRKNIVQYTDCFGKVFTEEELAILARIIRQNITSHFRRFEENMDKLFDFMQDFFEIIGYHVDHNTDMSKDLDLMVCHLYDLQQVLAHLVDLGVGYSTRVRKLLDDMRSENSEAVHEDYEGFLKDFLSFLEKLITIISDLKDFFLHIFEIVDCCNH